MAEVFTKTSSGLLVPDHAAGDERAIARLLKEYDSDLRLVPQQNGYRVYRYAGSDRPAEFILYWGDSQGNPYPLSSALLDEVRKLDKNQRGNKEYQTPEAINAAESASRAKKAESDNQDLIDDWKVREGRSAVLPRGVHLRRARSKTGYHEQ